LVESGATSAESENPMNVLRLLALSGNENLDEAEEELGRPEALEESDLALHVGRCAKRWKFSYIQARETKRAVDQLRLLVLLVILLMGLNARPEIAKSVMTIFGMP
jgi:hypothetical protein